MTQRAILCHFQQHKVCLELENIFNLGDSRYIYTHNTHKTVCHDVSQYYNSHRHLFYLSSHFTSFPFLSLSHFTALKIKSCFFSRFKHTDKPTMFSMKPNETVCILLNLHLSLRLCLYNLHYIVTFLLQDKFQGVTTEELKSCMPSTAAGPGDTVGQLPSATCIFSRKQQQHHCVRRGWRF